MYSHLPCVSPTLKNVLSNLMENPLFSPFRLVGGTNLALRFGHRESVDIDLFTDKDYGSIDFKEIEKWLQSKFSYYDSSDKSSKVGMGRTYYIGSTSDDAIKLDLMYENSHFLFPEIIVDDIRMATVEEIGVMKLDAIFYGGRKKDFWDLHYLLFDQGYNLESLIELHAKRFEYEHDFREMLERLQNFDEVDYDPDPICRLGKFWDVVKLDILDAVEKLKN